jgi:hypothetical protein
MAVAPKPKASSPSLAPARAKPERTSTVVGVTLIGLAALGVLTIFWEPLAALAVGAPSADSVSDVRGTPADGGAATSPTPVGALDASGNS